MSMSDRLKEYEGLLRIRQKASRRDAWLIGGGLFICLVATLLFGALDPSFLQSLFLVLPILVALGAAYATAVARLDVTNACLDLVEALERSVANP
jgi:drug/metabolite transporter (DMT)-like permease